MNIALSVMAVLFDWGGEAVEVNKIYNEDCLIGMSKIPDGTIDMILCDLPY